MTTISTTIISVKTKGISLIFLKVVIALVTVAVAAAAVIVEVVEAV